MSQVRRIRKGAVWLITRRCAHRQFLIRPDRFVSRVLGYCLAYAAEKTGVEIHAFQFLSNHYHLVLTDREGALPDFMHIFSTLTSRVLNCYHRRRENFWASGTYSAVELLDEAAVIDKVVYVLTNVVAAALVRRHESWPGLTATVERIGGEAYQFERPTSGFFEQTTLPDRVSLRLTRPPCLEGVRLSRVRKELRAIVREREEEIAKQLRIEGRKFLGRAAVLAQDPTACPTTEESREGGNPQVACKDPSMRKEALRLLREFRRLYHEARERFLRGARKVVFPYGTWLLRVQFGARCAKAPC